MTALEREAAIVQLLPLVRRIAAAVRHRIPFAELEDIVGDGVLGLVTAIDTFDPARGMALDSFVRRRILYAILDGARRYDHLSQRARTVLSRAETDRYAIALELGRMPSRTELETRHPKLRNAQCSAYLCDRLCVGPGVSLDALVRPNWENDPAAILCARETERSIGIALQRLPDRHRELLRLYYIRGARLADLAARLSLTKQRVAQIRNVALANVRKEARVS